MRSGFGTGGSGGGPFRALVAVVLASGGCHDDAEPISFAETDGPTSSGGVGDGSTGDAPSRGSDGAETEPAQVPEAPKSIAAQTECTALEGDEAVASISPEGHVWLKQSGGRIRVFDPFDSTAIVVGDLDVGEVREVQAWTSTDAALITAGGLWRLEDLSRFQLTTPTDITGESSMCGDPSDNGFLLADGIVFERRGDGLWWSWDPAGDNAPLSIVRYDGDCLGPSDALWLRTADDGLVRLAGGQAFRVSEFAEIIDVAATDNTVAALTAEQLWIHRGTAWQPWEFPKKVPAQLSASDGSVWMLSGAQLLRYADDTWREVTHEMPEAATSVLAHPTGAWLVGETEICNLALQPIIRVEGLRPYRRSRALEHVIQVVASSDEPVTASVDGKGFPLTQDEETRRYVGTARLDSLGWHAVELQAGTSARTIAVKRLPEVVRGWEADIAPVYEANCTGSDCHGGNTAESPPAMDSHALWMANAEKIRSRVVEAQNMPPPNRQGEDWGPEQVEVVLQWLEGGLLP